MDTIMTPLPDRIAYETEGSRVPDLNYSMRLGVASDWGRWTVAICVQPPIGAANMSDFRVRCNEEEIGIASFTIAPDTTIIELLAGYRLLGQASPEPGIKPGIEALRALTDTLRENEPGCSVSVDETVYVSPESPNLFDEGAQPHTG